MTEEEKKVFMKIKDRHKYFTGDDKFEETNDFEKECLFEIGYLTQIIEKLQKENEELRHSYDIATTKTEELKKKLGLKQFDVNVVYNDYLEKLREFKSNSIPKHKIREIINEELPDDEICKVCEKYDVNGVVIKQKLIKLLEEE